jgi:DNA-binding XRE family transcriptional regulator
MDPKKKKALEAAGWTFGDYGDLLGLTDEERRMVELRLALTREIRRRREGAGITQTTLARRIGSSQARIARVEAGAGDVAIDLMLRTFFALGGRVEELATPPPAPAPPTEQAKTPRAARAGKAKAGA